MLCFRLHLDFALVGIEQLHLLLKLQPQGLAFRFLSLIQPQLEKREKIRELLAAGVSRWRVGCDQAMQKFNSQSRKSVASRFKAKGRGTCWLLLRGVLWPLWLPTGSGFLPSPQ